MMCSLCIEYSSYAYESHRDFSRWNNHELFILEIIRHHQDWPIRILGRNHSWFWIWISWTTIIITTSVYWGYLTEHLWKSSKGTKTNTVVSPSSVYLLPAAVTFISYRRSFRSVHVVRAVIEWLFVVENFFLEILQFHTWAINIDGSHYGKKSQWHVHFTKVYANLCYSFILSPSSYCGERTHPIVLHYLTWNLKYNEWVTSMR